MVRRGWWQRYLDWRRRPVASLHLTDDGFDVRHGRESAAMRWEDIVEVVAFKRDLLTHDLLCLLVRGGARIVELREELPGYPAIEAAMLARLGISTIWKLEVLFHAFAVKPTPLFRDGRSLWPIEGAAG